MVAVVDSAVVLLNVRQKVVDEVTAEHISSELCLRCCGSRWGGQQLIRITVWQYHDHLLCGTFCQQVVKDIVHASHLIVHLFSICRSTDEIEHRVFLVGILLITWWQIHHGIVGCAKALGIVMDIFNTTVYHVTYVMCQRFLVVVNLKKTVLESLVGEILRILGVHDADTVNDEAVGVHIRSRRTQRYCPCSGVGIFHHRVSAGKLHVNQHFLCIVVPVAERHRTVRIARGRCLGTFTFCLLSLPFIEAIYKVNLIAVGHID